MKSRSNASRRIMLLAFVLSAASAGVALPAEKDLAPADAYFGRMKMSYLGINNTFSQQQAWARPHSTDSGIANKIHWADDALLDWQKRYPKDPQIARSYFMATQVMRLIWIKEYQDKAWDYMNLVIKRFPNTFFAKTLKKDLAIGFTERYYMAAVPCNADGSEPADKPTPPAIPPQGSRKYEVLAPACTTPAPTPAAAVTPPPPAPSASPAPTPL